MIDIKALSQEWTYLTIGGKHVDRIKFGEESQVWELERGAAECFCGSLRGTYHMLACDQSQCPACGQREVDCDCDVEP